MSSTISALHINSPLGPITLAASDQGLCGLWFEDQKHSPSVAQRQLWASDPYHPVLQNAAAHVLDCLNGKHPKWEGPLDLSVGTPFQQAVWQALLHIPSGQSQTYGELARQLARPQAVRALGAAVGRNPVSIIVPCHRVLGAGGQLTGYAGGLWRKQALLQLEGHPGI
jgi:methylated-DNA-[protein]-cysteine S-methyltransferase